MKQTLVEMVQDIMSDMDSDLVNSIDDSPEAQQVAQIIKTTFYDIITNREWPHLRELNQLNGATITKPTHCSLPARTKELVDVRYDVQDSSSGKKVYQKIEYIYPEDFLDMVMSRDSTADNVMEVVDDSGVTLNILTDKAPQYYTSFDDEVLVFDSYDSSVDSFIQNSKTSIIMYREPTWLHSDSFVPDLPSEAFSLLLAESKSRAFLALSQEANEKAEQQAYRSRVWLSRKAYQVKGGISYPDYGRRSRK